MLVAGLTAAAVAGSSYLLVREARLHDSVDGAVERARVNLTLALELLERGPEPLLAAYERRGGFVTVGRTGSGTFSSSLSVGAEQVPREMTRLVRRGELAYQRTSVAGTRYLVVGGRVAGTETELYFFFSEEELWGELAELRNVLLGASVALVLLGGLIGMLLARRTLAPVGRASEAARSLAEGLLETRLPVEREDEFGAWAASFNEMADALQAKIDALSRAQARERRFTSDVAHELRTPLTALVAEAALLRDHLDLMPNDPRRPHELLLADVGRLRNLVGNAIEHGGRDVSVHVARDGVGALVEVSDRGQGIAPEHLAHLFDRFYKVDPARAGPGSGLGLAIALENARLLGGELDVWSEPGVGTRFTLRLSVTESLPDRHSRVARVADDERGSNGGGTP